MKKLFFDPVANIYLKILPNEDKLQRELVGACIFKDFVAVGFPERLDNRTLGIIAVDGKVSTSIPMRALNRKVMKLFEKVTNDFNDIVIEKYSIDGLVRNLIRTFELHKGIIEFLKQTRRLLQEVKYIPLHGDLQKQNILINKHGELVLIDFEHFCYGPLELELANSFFHDDDNCLDVSDLIMKLFAEKQISIMLLQHMIVLYGLKELSQGTSVEAVEGGISLGQRKLMATTGSKEPFIEMSFDRSIKSPSQFSSCLL